MFDIAAVVNGPVYYASPYPYLYTFRLLYTNLYYMEASRKEPPIHDRIVRSYLLNIYLYTRRYRIVALRRVLELFINVPRNAYDSLKGRQWIEFEI